MFACLLFVLGSVAFASANIQSNGPVVSDGAWTCNIFYYPYCPTQYLSGAHELSDSEYKEILKGPSRGLCIHLANSKDSSAEIIVENEAYTVEPPTIANGYHLSLQVKNKTQLFFGATDGVKGSVRILSKSDFRALFPCPHAIGAVVLIGEWAKNRSY